MKYMEVLAAMMTRIVEAPVDQILTWFLIYLEVSLFKMFSAWSMLMIHYIFALVSVKSG